VGISSELFHEIRKLIPGIPENVVRMSLVIESHSAPIVQCECVIKNVGKISGGTKTFEVIEREAH
jgi:hypothetical protein